MPHPVVELVLRRAASGSRPGFREDGAVLGLCIEGGAMRGVVSAGMVAGLEQLGLLPVFDLVVGCSAGAANAAYFVAGQATVGSTIYCENINNRRFIDPARALAGRPAVNLDFLIGSVMGREKPLDTHAVLASPIPLVMVASDTASGESQRLASFADAADLLGCIRATATMPILAGPPYPHRGGRYWDGSLTEPVPTDTAIRLGCTHLLVLLTRPAGIGRPPLSFFQRRVVLPRIRRVSPRLAAHFKRQHEEYGALMGRLDSRASAAGPPHVFALRPVGPLVSNLERRQPTLAAAREEGISAVFAAFGSLRAALPLAQPLQAD